jgi:hypothetical protein
MARVLSTALALVVFSVIAVTTAAGGENGHTYNGSFCKPMGRVREGPVQEIIYNRDGIENTNSPEIPPVNIICPILVDEVEPTSGTTRVSVNWSTPNDNSELKCRLFSMTEEGKERQENIKEKTGSGRLTFDNINADDVEGSYVITCELPSLSKLHTIWVGEQTE